MIAASVAKFDRWMLPMTVGMFCAAYPLMCFTQEYISLGNAILASAALMIVIIDIRAVTLMQVWLALVGVVLSAAAIMAINIVAAINTQLQCILLTVEALGFFISAMMLMPNAWAMSSTGKLFGQRGPW